MKLEQAVFHMTDVMLRDPGIQEIADEASKILGLPLWLTNLNYHFLTNPGAVYPVDERLMEGYRFGMIAKECLLYLHHKKMTETINQHKGPYVFFDESLHSTLAVTAVRIKDIVVAHLVVREVDAPIREFDIAFLNRLKDIISLELQRNFSARLESTSVTSLVLNEMLERKCSTMDRVYNRLEAAKYTLGKDFRLIIVCREIDDQEDFPWSTVAGQMDSLFWGTVSTDYCRCLVILLNQDTDITDYQIEQFSQVLRYSNLKAGISYRFHDLANLYQVYCEVQDLISIKEQMNSAERLYRYEDCIVDMAAAQLVGKLDKHSIAGDAIAKVAAYDKRYTQEVMSTLKAYVACSFNIKRTAEKLHVHENTMRYRAKRLEEIIGIDLTDSRYIFELVLALKIMEINASRNNSHTK